MNATTWNWFATGAASAMIALACVLAAVAEDDPQPEDPASVAQKAREAKHLCARVLGVGAQYTLQGTHQVLCTNPSHPARSVILELQS